ncbi:transposase [Methylocapsa aurea]|uniref:transposase n=1 Tax=Methylocapsa aurea TaxID=663610 RepID=UPI000A0628C1
MTIGLGFPIITLCRKDDRLILSGIMHVLKVRSRCADCPKNSGPYRTIYNRFAHWSKRGIWQKLR